MSQGREGGLRFKAGARVRNFIFFTLLILTFLLASITAVTAHCENCCSQSIPSDLPLAICDVCLFCNYIRVHSNKLCMIE